MKKRLLPIVIGDICSSVMLNIVFAFLFLVCTVMRVDLYVVAQSRPITDFDVYVDNVLVLNKSRYSFVTLFLPLANHEVVIKKHDFDDAIFYVDDKHREVYRAINLISKKFDQSSFISRVLIY